MVTLALCVLFAANVCLVVLLAAMWTARSPRYPHHADFLELAGLLRAQSGAKAAAWTRAGSVLAAQCSRRPWWHWGLRCILGRSSRLERKPLLCIHCSDFRPLKRGLIKAHSWPPAHEAPQAGGRPDVEAPPLSASRSLVAPSHKAAQSAQQPCDAAAVPDAALPSKGEACRTVLRALYKQQFARTGAGGLPQDSSAPSAPDSAPEGMPHPHREPRVSPFTSRATANHLSPSPLAPFPSASSCPVSINGDLCGQGVGSSGQGLGSKPTRSFDTVFDALLETSVSSLLGASHAGALIGTKLARGYSTDSAGSIHLDMLPA